MAREDVGNKIMEKAITTGWRKEELNVIPGFLKTKTKNSG